MIRLHKSSCVVASLALVVCILIVVPGQTKSLGLYEMQDFSHGWPATFLDRFVSDQPPYLLEPIGPPWLHSKNWKLWHGSRKDWDVANLAFDILIMLAMAVVVTSAWEFRRRRIGNVYQLRLKEVFIATVMVALVLYWVTHHIHSHAVEQQHRLAIDEKYTPWSIGFDCVAPKWIQRLVGRRCIPEFFTRTTSLSLNWDDRGLDEREIKVLLSHLESLIYLERLDVYDVGKKRSAELREAIESKIPNLEVECY